MHSAAILAGGRATRFGGRDKSALLVGGRTIRDRQMAVLADVAADVIVVDAARDVVPGSGPLGGIYTALTLAQSGAVFVVACDMPFLDAAFIRYLLRLSEDADVVVPRTEEGYHPLCAVYTRACLDPIARRLADRRLKVSDVFAELRVQAVDSVAIAGFGDPHRLLANVNTPADHARLEALQGHEL